MHSSSFAALLPQFLCDLLAAPPRTGEGVHAWLYKVARQLHVHRSEADICALLAAAVSDCGRVVTAKEIADAVRNSRATAWQPHGMGAHAESSTPAQPKWPVPDFGLLREVIRTRYTVAQIGKASPVPVANLTTRDVLTVLFPGNPLLTVGKSDRNFHTLALPECLPWAHECSFIVPSAATKREGLTQVGKPSQHCLDIVGPRQYLCCETDLTHEGEAGELLTSAKADHGLDPLDVAACVVEYLDQFLPRLAIVTHSGGKSLHALFNVADRTSPDEPDGARLRVFMRNAALVGCDHRGWCRSQFARMPGGTRRAADGTPVCAQTILFFNPRHCLKP